MIFIICVIIGILGIAGTLWMSGASLRYLENPIASGEEWFRVNPDLTETTFAMKMREQFRDILKEILIWLIGIYRRLSQKITVKQAVKKHVRAFLYDHVPDGARHPSEFWQRVRHPERAKRTRKSAAKPVIVEDVSEEPVIVDQNPDHTVQ